ncbi:MAG: amidohydrolase family protein, partial [Acidobacteria bacterium]|nr:amidohydrolase family protein [Acidobacteriota bacterium]
GDEVAQNFLSPVKSMLDAGVKVVFEMDRDDYVWHDLEIFITRTDDEGNVWGPHEAVDRVTALKMITRWAAVYVLRGDQLGSIEPGKLADLAVLDRDYMTIPETEISEIRSRMTVMDGKIVHLLPQFVEENNINTDSSVMSPGATVATLEELRARRTPRSRR